MIGNIHYQMLLRLVSDANVPGADAKFVVECFDAFIDDPQITLIPSEVNRLMRIVWEHRAALPAHLAAVAALSGGIPA